MRGLNVDCPAQRVFNAYHHLADGTLPPDLWNESTELAAIVFLAVNYPVHAAFARLQSAVREYNAVNRKLRLPQLFFDPARTKRKFAAVSRYIATAPRSTHVGAIYTALLQEGHGRRIETFYGRALQSRLDRNSNDETRRQARYV